MKIGNYINRQLKEIWEIMREAFTAKRLILIFIGTVITSFGLYNVHDQCRITEGGVLGMILLLQYWLNMKPSIGSPILNVLCYVLSAKELGKRFIIISVYSAICMALTFKVVEAFPPVLPNMSDKPILAAVVGALFIGIGAGIVIRGGGTTSGDDALALFISKKTGWRLSLSYLITDLTVLVLSLTYIPFGRIIYSVITVTLSSLLIDLIQSVGKKEELLEQGK